MSSSACSRWAERHARRTTRWDLGVGLTSASSRSPIACGAALSISSVVGLAGATVSNVSRLDSTSSATWRSATSRSAARFSILKKLFERRLDALAGVDLAGAQAGDQRLRREVDEHDLVGLAEHAVGQRLAHARAGELGRSGR